jgi:hypothetical protein
VIAMTQVDESRMDGGGRFHKRASSRGPPTSAIFSDGELQSIISSYDGTRIIRGVFLNDCSAHHFLLYPPTFDWRRISHSIVYKVPVVAGHILSGAKRQNKS